MLAAAKTHFLIQLFQKAHGGLVRLLAADDDHARAVEEVGAGILQPGDLFARHRMAADVAEIARLGVDAALDRPLHAAKIGDDGAVFER